MALPGAQRCDRGSGVWGVRAYLVQRALDKLVASFSHSPCSFALTLPDGRSVTFGAGTPAFRVNVKSSSAMSTLATLDEGHIADAYITGEFDITGDFLAVMELRNYFHDRHPVSNARRFVDALLFGQVRANARAIKAHYDLAPEFFLSFLGTSRCYTQGIFASDNEPLEVAVRRKFDYCMQECRIESGTRMLDVGAGWGGWATYAAQRGVRVTGLTISEKSREFLCTRGKRPGIEWDIIKEDFFAYCPSEQFDAVVIMGVMEHLPDYPRVVKKLLELVKPGGFVYLDASAQRVKWEASSFIYRHIYPGNHSFFDCVDFLAALAKTPLRLRSVLDDRHSYYLTFTHWARNLEAHRESLIENFSEAHFRRFQLYLWGAAHSFATDVLQCYRIVIEKPV